MLDRASSGRDGRREFFLATESHVVHDEIVRFALLNGMGDLHDFLFFFQGVLVAADHGSLGEFQKSKHFRPFEFLFL